MGRYWNIDLGVMQPKKTQQKTQQTKNPHQKHKTKEKISDDVCRKTNFLVEWCLFLTTDGYTTDERWSAGGRTEALSSVAKMLAPADKKTGASDTIISLLLEFSKHPEMRRKKAFMLLYAYLCLHALFRKVTCLDGKCQKGASNRGMKAFCLRAPWHLLYVLSPAQSRKQV